MDRPNNALVSSLKTDGFAGDLDAYTRLSPKLKMGSIEDEFSGKTGLSSPQPRQGATETDVAGQVKTGLPTLYSAANFPTFRKGFHV